MLIGLEVWDNKLIIIVHLFYRQSGADISMDVTGTDLKTVITVKVKGKDKDFHALQLSVNRITCDEIDMKKMCADGSYINFVVCNV